MHFTLHHIGLLTKRPDDLIRFYSESLGFEVTVRKDVPRGLMEAIFNIPMAGILTKLKSGDTLIEILSAEGSLLTEKNIAHSGWNHIGLGVEDKEGLCRELERKGEKVIRFDSEGRILYFIRDPDGNLIEIYQPERALC